MTLLTREELNAELSRFCRARLREDDNSGNLCTLLDPDGDPEPEASDD